MVGGSDYERSQVEALLGVRERRVVGGTAVYLCREGKGFEEVFEGAVGPALRKNGIEALLPWRVFDSDSPVAVVMECVQTVEVLLVDLTGYSPDLMYVLGVAHAMGRCPVLMCRRGMEGPPFDLGALRVVWYGEGAEGVRELRELLERVVRVQLVGVRAKKEEGGGER